MGEALAGKSTFWGRSINTNSKYGLGFLASGNEGGTMDTNLNCLTWVREGSTNDGQTGNALYQNTLEVTLTNIMGASVVNLTATPYMIGKNLNGAMKTDISELLVYSKKLSDGERMQVERYLMNKWGV